MGLVSSPSDWAVVVCWALLLACYGALAAPEVARAVAAGWRLAIAGGVRGLFCGRQGDEQEVQVITQTMNGKRVVHLRYLLKFLCTLCALNTAVSLAKTVAGQSRTLSLSQDLALLAVFAFLLCAGPCLGWRPSAAVHGLYFVVSVGCLFIVAVADEPTEAYFLLSRVRSLRLALSLAYMNGNVVCCVAVVHCSLTSLAFSRFDSQAISNSSITPSAFAQDELAFGVFLAMLTWGLEHIAMTSTRQSIELASARGEAGATRRLLNTICDATLELDAELTILNDAWQLAGALQHGFNRSLKGAKIERFVVESDRDFFLERIAAPVPESQWMANVFHVGMRDSLSNDLRVEVFHVPIVGSLTGSEHLLGIREHADTAEPNRYVPQFAEAHLASGRESSTGQRVDTAIQRSDHALDLQRFGHPSSSRRPSVAASESGSDGMSQSGSSLTLEPVMSEDFGEVAITFEDQGLRVLSSTPGFTALCGQTCATPCLQDWLKDSITFEKWTQHTVNVFASHCHFRDLVLRTPFLTNAGLEAVAGDVYIDSICNTSTEDGDSYVIRVSLFDTRQRALRQRRASGSRSRGGRRRGYASTQSHASQSGLQRARGDVLEI